MGDIAFPATLECSWSSRCLWGTCCKFPAWSPCSLCAWSPKWPCPMPSPVSSTAVPASLPRQASTTHSTFLFSRLQDRVPMHHHAKALAHENKHTQMPISMCMHLTTCSLTHTCTCERPFASTSTNTHAHTYVHAPLHTHFLTRTWTSTCAQALSWAHTDTDMHIRCPCACTCPRAHGHTRTHMHTHMSYVRDTRRTDQV